MFHQQFRNTEEKNLIEKGFTLVELLIVIVIMGILAGIVVFAVGNLTSDAQNNSCKTEQSTLETAVEAYRAHANNSSANPTMSDLVSQKLIKSASVNYDINTSGEVVAVAGQACA